MSDTVISVENLSKRYIIGHQRNRHDGLRHQIEAALRNPWRWLGARSKKREVAREEFWALKSVSFEVKQGEVLGIIGRNGAGKSTLLKILSRITEPTAGRVRLKGRVASLLEVGTGFHPELTGRENIYLNGAILGMTRAEIKSKFDAIVAFSEIEKFLDTPVKHYSSGMYVRLAFAVAAHLEPEILIVDEVLAVGDAAFQKKCLGKMKDVSIHQGRTVLFVTHNMGMITSLCSRVVLLENGALTGNGRPSNIVLRYAQEAKSAPHVLDLRSTLSSAPADHLARLLYACVENENGDPICEVDIRQPFVVRMDFEVLQDVPTGPYPNLHFLNSRGESAFISHGTNLVRGPVSRGIYSARCTVPSQLLNNETYFINLGLTFIHNGIHLSFGVDQALSFNVVDPIEETLIEARAGYSGPIPGVVRPKLNWETSRIS